MVKVTVCVGVASGLGFSFGLSQGLDRNENTVC